MANYVLPALCILLAVGHLSAGNLVLNVKPDKISPGLTSDLNINCSFTFNNEPNISSVISLIITKAEPNNSEPGPFSDIITINSFTNQVIGKENTNATTSGHIDSNTLNAYLSLSWSFPSHAESGFYRCDANVLDNFGRPVDLTASAQVVSTEPDLAILIGIVGKLQNDLISQAETISDLQTKLDQQDSDLRNSLFTKSQTRNGSYYLASTLYVSGLQLADYLCTRANGYVVEIDDDSERQFIVNFLGDMDTTHYFTIGTRKNESGQWVFYHSGRPVSYFKWYSSSEPGRDNCTNLSTSSGYMYGQTCDQYGPYPFLCEVPES